MSRDPISQTELQQFETDGFVRLGRVLNEDALGALQQRIDHIMLGEVRYDGMMMQLDSVDGDYGNRGEDTIGFKGPTLKYRKIEELEKDPLFLNYLKSDLTHSIAKSIIGDEVTIYRSMFMNKPAGFGTMLPWHQDGGEIWSLDIDPVVTIWLAIDPASRENGCVQIIPKSHKLGLLSKFGHTITAEQEQEFCTDDKIMHCELAAGEAMLLHNFVLHRSDQNHSKQSRRAFSVCLMDASTRSLKNEQHVYPKLFGTECL